MSKKIRFGLAAGLALAAFAPAWAGEEQSGEKTTSATARPGETGTSVTLVTTSGPGSAVETGSSGGTPAGSSDVKASHDVKASQDERWLREREGYRDGGY